MVRLVCEFSFEVVDIDRKRESLEILERLGLDFVALDNRGNVGTISRREAHTLFWKSVGRTDVENNYIQL